MAFTLVLAGCTSSQPEGPSNGTEGEDAGTGSSDENCRSRSTSTERGDQAQMVCEAVDGPATHTESFDCQNPDRSAARVATNLTDGSLHLLVTDPADTVLVDRTYDQTGGENDTIRIGEGEAGQWTVEAERSDAFEGSFGLGVACATPQ